MEDIFYGIDLIYIVFSLMYMTMSDADSLVFAGIPIVSALLLVPQVLVWDFDWEIIVFYLFFFLYGWAGITIHKIQNVLHDALERKNPCSDRGDNALQLSCRNLTITIRLVDSDDAKGKMGSKTSESTDKSPDDVSEEKRD